MEEIVLFTQRVEIVESYNERRDCTDQRIPQFIQECGYLPVPLPNDKNLASNLVSALNPTGIVLTGGNSLVKYGGNAPERDETDYTLIELAIQRNIPLYGFCRGMQSILDYFGNELVEVSGHVAVKHKVHGRENETEVNSYHNQGCKRLKSDALKVLLTSDDGVIEKVQHRDLPIIGTMWHPEREEPYRDDDIRMVKELFKGDK